MSAKKRKEPRNVQPGFGTVNSKFARSHRILRPHDDSIETRGQSLANSIGLRQDFSEMGVDLFNPGTRRDHQRCGEARGVNGRKQFHWLPSLASDRPVSDRERFRQDLPAGGHRDHFHKAASRFQRLEDPPVAPKPHQPHPDVRRGQHITRPRLLR